MVGLVTKQIAGQQSGNQCTSIHKNTSDCLDRNNSTIMPQKQIAMDRVRKFKFVGLTSQWELSICLFHTMFGGTCLPVEFSNLRRGNYSAGDANPYNGRVDPYDGP